ncbi:MAG: rubredoxin-like domain-containing protein [Betaproteobacteria bacterium]
MMKPYRCRLCGETYLGESAPDRCPYCGAAGKYVVPAAEWADLAGIPASDPETIDLCRGALDLEVSNTAFYQASRKQAELMVNGAIFARLSKQEQEHAEVFARLLSLPAPTIPQEGAPQPDAEKFDEAHRREHRALKYYQDAALRAKAENVREVFRIVSEVELEHLRLSNTYR